MPRQMPRKPTWMYRTLKAAGLPSTLSQAVGKIDGSLVQVGGQLNEDGSSGEYWEDFSTDGQCELVVGNYRADDRLPSSGKRYLSGCLTRDGGFTGDSSIYRVIGGTYLIRTVSWWTSWGSEVRGITQVLVTPEAKFQVAQHLQLIMSGSLNPRVERLADRYHLGLPGGQSQTRCQREPEIRH